MKRSLVIPFIVSLAVAGSAVAQDVVPTAVPTPDPLGKVCPKLRTLPDKGFIYKNSAPLRAGGPGTPLVGYRREPSLLGMARGVLSHSGTTIYDGAGKKLGRCPWTTAHGTSSGRYRCTMDTAGLRRKAFRNTKSPAVYFKLVGKTCLKVPDAGKCYGSVKGLCNRIIK